jgi:signal transduction histidine kinase
VDQAVDQILPGHRHGWPYWGRILIVNATGAIVAFAVRGGLAPGLSWAARLGDLTGSFVVANCIGSVMALLMPPILHRLHGRSRAIVWGARLVAIPVMIVIGCALAGGVAVLIGAGGADQYVAFVRGSLWISFVVGTVACLAVIAYETLHGQLDETTFALRTKERDEADARRVAAEAQLASLESRVNPHFLFNTLNSIAALTHDDPAAAERMTNQLASLMRSSLDTASTPLVPLEEELRVVRDYLQIERVRLGDRLRFTVDVPAAADAVLVPRLSLQTLVENSVKYAVSARREGGAIAIGAAVTASGVRLEVEDDGPGFDPACLPEGHGLALLNARMAMMFGERARFDVDSRPGRTLVAIEVPR